MIDWLTDYWYLCLVALLIGNATGAWIWLGGKTAVPIEPDIDEIAQPPRRATEPERPRLEPMRPDIVAAKQATFAPAPTVAATVPTDDTDRPAIAAAIGAPDDLRQIKGIGPKLVTLLNALGITRFDQIAAWTPTDIAEVDRYLGAFQGRIDQDDWVGQAAYLARGDWDGFKAKFGAPGQG